MSFAWQSVWNRQSCHTATIRPAPSTSAAGTGGARNGLASLKRRPVTITGGPSVTPPSVERTATMPVRGDQKKSVSVPFGWTTGITPVTGM